MSSLHFVQLIKGNKDHFEVAKSLWVPFINEVSGHDGRQETEEKMIENLQKRIAIQGRRKDMHFEIAYLNDQAIGIAMFAIDLGTVYGLLERGYGTVMGFYIVPAYRRKGYGRLFWEHIREILQSDGAVNFYVCPDSVTGIPFWKSMGFEDSGKIDPDDKKSIYVKWV